MEQCARERQPLLHPVRVRVHRPLRGLRQADGVQELGGALARGAAAQAVQAGEEDEVLEAGQAQVERAVAGGHHPDQLAQLAGASGAAVEHVGRAALGSTSPDRIRIRRRLPGAVGTEKRMDLAGLDLEADAAQRLDRAEPAVRSSTSTAGTAARATRVRTRVEANGGDRHVLK